MTVVGRRRNQVTLSARLPELPWGDVPGSYRPPFTSKTRRDRDIYAAPMASPRTRLSDRFPAMRSHDFRRLFVNGFASTGSRWAQVLARGWLVHDLSGGSSAAVGWVTFASFIPFVVVGPVVGTLADRLDRRRVLIWATAFGVAGALGLALITVAGVVQTWHVGLLAFATGSAQAASVPTRQALIANAVPEEDLLNAVALGGISQHGSKIVGPLFAAAFLKPFGPSAVFFISAALLGLALIEVLRLRTRSPQRSEPGAKGAAQSIRRLGADLAAAGTYVRTDRRLLTIIGLVGAHCSLTMAFDAMMPALTETLDGAEGLYSSIVVAIGIGATIGTVGVSQLRRDQLRGTAFVLTGVGSGLAMIIMGLADNATTVLLAASLAGLTQASYMTLSASLVQKVVDDAYRARVMSFYIMIAAGHMAILNLGFGRLAENIDVRTLLVVPGLIWVIVFAVAGALGAQARNVMARGTFALSTSPHPGS